MMFSTQTIMYWSIVVATVTAFIHIAFGVAVMNDATNLKSSNPNSLKFVGPFLGMLTVLLGGVLIVGLYWLIHHSSLNNESIHNTSQ